MRYITPEDIYKNVEIGIKISYSKSEYKRENYSGIGIITEIKYCKWHDYNCGVCNILIGIDGLHPTCFVYGGGTAIKWIEKENFITESEMII